MTTPEFKPKELIEQTMKLHGVSKEVAIYAAVKGFEATLRANSMEEEVIGRETAKLLIADTRARHPLAIELLEATYRKHLPEWIRIHDEAMEKGRDAATAMSIVTNCSMRTAESRIRRVREAKDGKSIEQIAQLSLAEDEGKTDEELFAEYVENQQI